MRPCSPSTAGAGGVHNAAGEPAKGARGQGARAPHSRLRDQDQVTQGIDAGRPREGAPRCSGRGACTGMGIRGSGLISLALFDRVKEAGAKTGLREATRAPSDSSCRSHSSREVFWRRPSAFFPEILRAGPRTAVFFRGGAAGGKGGGEVMDVSCPSSLLWALLDTPRATVLVSRVLVSDVHQRGGIAEVRSAREQKFSSGGKGGTYVVAATRREPPSHGEG